MIILFDGLCNLCNGSVNFILKRDKDKKYKFASLQSEIGKELCKQYDIDTNVLARSAGGVDSIIFIKNDKVFIKSAAVLEILKDLPIGWRVFRSGIILPKVIRDWLGKEVTGDVKYFNSMLMKNPYSTWKK